MAAPLRLSCWALDWRSPGPGSRCDGPRRLVANLHSETRTAVATILWRDARVDGSWEATPRVLSIRVTRFDEHDELASSLVWCVSGGHAY